MIDIDIALVTRLTTTAAVTALIGTRMHPLRLPDTPAFPAITYQAISAPINATMDESSGNALTHARYQVDCWAINYAGSVALAKAVFDALHGFSGVVTKGADTFTIQACLRVDKRQNDDPETSLWWCSQDFVLWYQGG